MTLRSRRWKGLRSRFCFPTWYEKLGGIALGAGARSAAVHGAPFQPLCGRAPFQPLCDRAPFQPFWNGALVEGKAVALPTVADQTADSVAESLLDPIPTKKPERFT
jgi:hypothetical protein